MRIVGVVGLLVAVSSATLATAADKPFTGVFKGTGRACSGALYIRAKTIQWNSTYSICKSPYDVAEKNLTGDHQRMVYRLKARSSRCRYEVVEVAHADGYSWNVNGYQSLEAFQNKDLPDWKNSALPERQILSCPMIRD